MIRKISLFFLGVMMFSLQIKAQETRGLTLTEAIRLGVENSKNLKRTQNSLDKATASVDEAKDRKLPDLKLSGQYMRMAKASFGGPLLESLSGKEAGDGSSGGGGGVSPNQVLLGMANASIPVFSGNRINNGIQAAKYLEKAASFDVEDQKEAVIENTIEAYYNLYKAQSYVTLVKENLKTSEQRVKDFSNLEKNGIIPRNDLLSAQLQQKNMELAVLEAENNQKIANYNFDLMIGLDENTTLELQSPDFNTSLLPLQDLETDALQSRNDVQSLDNRLHAAEYATKVTKGAYWPSVVVSGMYAALDVHKVLTAKNLMNAGVALSYNLSDLYKTKSKVRQSIAQEKDVQIAQSELTDQIKMQVHKAYQDYLESIKRIDVLQNAIELANENYRIVKNKHDNSLATATELLDADASKLQANVNYEFAKVDSRIAYNKLLLASGLITKTYMNNK
ncbi:MAG: TolC family protein [Niabella sp.]